MAGTRRPSPLEGVTPARKTRSRAPASDPYGDDAARLHLLRTAEECFKDADIASASMSDIAVRAGVSRPTLYRYFGDKDTLIREIVGLHSRQIVRGFTTFLSRYASAEEKLVEGLIYLAQKGRKDPFLRSVSQSESLSRATRLLTMQGSVGHLFAEKVWQPVLDEGIASGELKADLDRAMAYYWLTTINLILFEWLDIDGGTQDYHREMLRAFVVPAFLSP